MKNKEYNVVTLSNGIEYTEVSRIKIDNNTYVFLSNMDNPEDFCIKKIIKKDNEELIYAIDSDEEFNKVMNEFAKNYLS